MLIQYWFITQIFNTNIFRIFNKVDILVNIFVEGFTLIYFPISLPPMVIDDEETLKYGNMETIRVYFDKRRDR